MMGSQGSKEVTLELEGDKFVQTGDGIKLSANIVNHMTLSPVGDNAANSIPSEPGFKSSPSEPNSEDVRQQFQELLDEREKEITKLKEKSQLDLENERAKNDKFYRLTLDEYTKAAFDVEQKFKHPSFKPVCENLQKLLVECYYDNPGKSLNCSKYLKDFQVCVQNTKEAVFKKNQAN